MHAVIQTGGKQYIVKKGDILSIEKIEGDAGVSVTFPDVLLTFDNETTTANIGKPHIAGARVVAEVVEQTRNKKISVIKYKPKVRYRRNVGHHQFVTKIKITDIVG